MCEPKTPFIVDWQEYVWLIVVFAAAVAAWFIIPTIDPRAGIDGWGDLFHALLNLTKGVLCVSIAWLCKAHFWSDFNYREEDSVSEVMQKSEHHYKNALTLYVLDRLGWLFWLPFWAWVLFVR